MTLTWKLENELEGRRTKSAGPTHFGRLVVWEMAALGMVTDVARLGRHVLVVRLETGNVVATHSNAAALCYATDRSACARSAIRAASSECALPHFLHGDKPGLGEIVYHIIGDLIGIDHVVVGFDFFDFLPARHQARSEAGAIPASVGHSSSSAIRRTTPTNFEGVRFTPELALVCSPSAGSVNTHIQCVLGKNLLRVGDRIEMAGRGPQARSAA